MKTASAHIWDSCDGVIYHLIPLYRGERNVDKLGLGFGFRGWVTLRNE